MPGTTSIATVTWDPTYRVGRINNTWGGEDGPLQQRHGKRVEWRRNDQYMFKVESKHMQWGGSCSKFALEAVLKPGGKSDEDMRICYQKEMSSVQQNRTELVYSGWIEVDDLRYPLTDVDATVDPPTGNEPVVDGYVQIAAPPPRIILADPRPFIGGNQDQEA